MSSRLLVSADNLCVVITKCLKLHEKFESSIRTSDAMHLTVVKTNFSSNFLLKKSKSRDRKGQEIDVKT